jgi:hypothetical protein
MNELSPDQLARIRGGAHTEQTTPYETCRGTMEQAAHEKYPDDRWFFQRWFGAKDGNADARKKWLDESLPGACGPAPTS